MSRVQGRKNDAVALRILRSSVVLVTPNFREKRTEEGGEVENIAIFLVTVSRTSAINARQQTARTAR